MLRVLLRAPLARTLSFAALLCTVWVSVSGLLHGDDDDPRCRVIVEVHDHSAHRMGGPGEATHEQHDHCYICHSHSLRSVVSTATVWSPSSTEAGLTSSVFTAGSVELLRRRPARAPPFA